MWMWNKVHFWCIFKFGMDYNTTLIPHGLLHYGNTGCGVFKGGIQNYKGFWLKINCSQMKSSNFDTWSSGKLSKIGHHFRNKVIWKWILSKILITKNVLLNSYSSIKKNQEDSDEFWKSNFGTFWQLATTPILQIWWFHLTTVDF